jgi:hypothetical protein
MILGIRPKICFERFEQPYGERLSSRSMFQPRAARRLRLASSGRILYGGRGIARFFLFLEILPFGQSHGLPLAPLQVAFSVLVHGIASMRRTSDVASSSVHKYHH